MTVSERTVDGTFLEGNGSLVCAILRQPESRGVLQWLQFSQRWDLALTLLLQGHVRGFCVTGLPFCAGQLCLHLPVTFKAQGFKSRGGGTFVASALLASPSVQDFQQLSVVFVSS